MRRAANVVDLGLVPYEQALALQRSVADAVGAGDLPDTVLFLEHPPTITLGRRADPRELHVPEGAEVEIVETDRGGKSTYHAPGQLVCYPILDLTRHGQDVQRYCRDLEEALIRTLATYGLTAGRRPPYTGVWVGDRKVAAIGVAVRRWVAFHGFALNVDPDLTHFDLIHPCGIRHLGVASMASLLGQAPPREQVLDRLATEFARVWDRPVLAAPLEASPSIPFPEESSHV